MMRSHFLMVMAVSAPGKYHLLYFWNESDKNFMFALNIIFNLPYITPSYQKSTSSCTSPMTWSRTNQSRIITKERDLSVHFTQLKWFVAKPGKFKMEKKFIMAVFWTRLETKKFLPIYWPVDWGIQFIVCILRPWYIINI